MLDATGSHADPTRRIQEAPELSVSGAVVQYRRRHLVGADRERIDDVGIALVLYGRCAQACTAMELGSNSIIELDLSHELVVLGWVELDTLNEVRRIAEATGPSGRAPKDAGPFCFGIALRALRTLGYSTITRPSLLRIGFRDVLRDLDPDGARQVRLALSQGRIARVTLDADANSLRVDVPAGDPGHAAVEAALTEAFPSAELRRDAEPDGASHYQVRLPLPLSMTELRSLIEQMRAGLSHLFWRFEPARSQVVAEQIAAFGRRDSLSRLDTPVESPVSPSLRVSAPTHPVVH